MQVLENLAAIFGDNLVAEDGKERIRELHEKIGELTVGAIFHMVFPLSSGSRVILVRARSSSSVE